jgi:protease I
MDPAPLEQLKVAALLADGVEVGTFHGPVEALRRAGATVEVISPKPGQVLGLHGSQPAAPIPAHGTLADRKSSQYDALLLVGGPLQADALRLDVAATRFVREMQSAAKPIASIGHGSWLLLGDGAARGRRMTGSPTLREDVRNAGAEWADEPVSVDGNWVTCRGDGDLTEFIHQMIDVFSRTTPPVIQVAESA